MNKLVVRCDGSCKPNNPGEQIYWAFTALSTGGNEVAAESGEIETGDVVTNNEAEYHAIIEGLRWVAANARDIVVEVQTDSQLAVKQVDGSYRCVEASLIPLRDEVRALLRQSRAKLKWIRRERNGLADAYANLAYQRAMVLKEFRGEVR